MEHDKNGNLILEPWYQNLEEIIFPDPPKRFELSSFNGNIETVVT